MGTRFDRPTTSKIRRPRGRAVRLPAGRRRSVAGHGTWRALQVAAALLIALAGMAPAAAQTDGTKKASQAPAAEHLIGPEDLLEITVFEVPQLNRTVRVSETGMISLPLLGELLVRGLTPTQLEARLRKALAKGHVEDPQVSVFVKEYRSRKVSVIGAVGMPGVYEILGPRTLLEVLSQAGGFTERTGTKVYVLRDLKDDGQERIVVNVADLMEKGDQADNVPIEPGDVISVPIDRPAYVYVDGAVRSPGRIEQVASRPLSLLQAIARAGGPTDRADLNDIQILIKTENGEQRIMNVNLKRVRKGKDPDPSLGDGDIVVVRESFF